MSLAVAEEPHVVHALPGRVRVHLPGWEGEGKSGLEAQLRRLRGVSDARASRLTRRVLVHFDPETTDDESILEAMRKLNPPAREEELRGSSVDYEAGSSEVSRQALRELEESYEPIEVIASELAGVEMPELPGEDEPTHPLDKEPAVEGGVRGFGALLGLGFLAGRRLLGYTGPPVAAGWGFAAIAGGIGLLEGFETTRNATHRYLGRRWANVAFGATSAVAFTLSGGTLGLAVLAMGGIQLFTQARARREAWRNYEDRTENAPPARPGAAIRVEPGERVPLGAEVLEGTGTAVGRDGLPSPVFPGATVAAGSKLYGGPFRVQLQGDEPFQPELPREAPMTPTLRQRYSRVLTPISIAYGVGMGLYTRSLEQAFIALLLLDPRTSEVGASFADAAAAERTIRSGVTIAATRTGREVRLPDILLLDEARVLTEGLEVNGVHPQDERYEASEILALASGISLAAESPWGRAFPGAERVPATDGTFDGQTATASVDGRRYSLGPVEDRSSVPASMRLRLRTDGDYLLELRNESEESSVGLIALRPRLAEGTEELVETCERHGVEIAVLGGGDTAAVRSIARRAGTLSLESEDAVEVVRERQRDGAMVALVSDSADAAPGFAAADLDIGLSGGRDGSFPARVDLLAPDLGAVAAIVEAGARRETAGRDSVLFALVSNVVGVAWGFWGGPARTGPTVETASNVVFVTALGAMTAGWARMRGGKRPGTALSRVADPRPERWGRRSMESVLRTLESTELGLTSEAALERRRVERTRPGQNKLLKAMLEQLLSPMTGLLAAGAGISLILGRIADVTMIGAVIVANAVVSAWQERQADQAAEALEALTTVTARVLRDGSPVTVPAEEVVPGDVLLLMSGDRVTGDARLIEAWGLEVDEAALTGESLPVPKGADAPSDSARIVLEGTDVVVGSGRAVVVAVGRHTRMGATAAALALEDEQQGALGLRLNRLLKQMMPLILGAGGIVAASGLLWNRPLLPQLAIGASVAIAAVPEGLPLLAHSGQAAVGKRLAQRNALVRRLSSIETAGRVDVACTDKTGTLTEGRLALTLVAGMDGEAAPSGGRLPTELRRVLLAAGLASPHPDAPEAESQLTDAAVIRGAKESGLEDELRVEREAEAPFDPVHRFRASTIDGRIYVKGAAEALVDRCERIRRDGSEHLLDDDERRELLDHAEEFAGRGLRVLMVAEGAQNDNPLNDPGGLTALGFLGISDPLRPTVPEAVRRCHEAGVRVIMLTGDHPVTARTIAQEAGLSSGDEAELLTGEEIAELNNSELDERLEHATVISRITPLDKVRIVESLQRKGHVVAMTGDGVNDAPALRLADVGVAMGRGGTEVARQASDVVLADDDFSTLVETLVEGRSFWRNIRRALGLLLGGNLGEVGLIASASIISPVAPLTARHILALNLISDVLPALAVAFQQPAHRNLAGLDREGESALERPLRNDIFRRGISTATLSLGTYLVALRYLSTPVAGSVAFGSIVATQLAQTLALGRNDDGGFNRSVVAAVIASSGMLVASLTVPSVRAFVGLTPLVPVGWALVGGAALASVPLNYALGSEKFLGGRLALESTPQAERLALPAGDGGAALSRT